MNRFNQSGNFGNVRRKSNKLKVEAALRSGTVPHLIESVQLLRCDSNLCRHLLELDLQVFEVDLVSVAEFLGGRHFGVEAVDAVLRLGNSGLKD